MPESSPIQGTASKRYATLEPDRDPYLRRARRLSRLTVPALFREEGDDGNTDHVLAWQSFGAYAVNNLSSKLLLSMFPPGVPFIKLEADHETLRGLAALGPTEGGELRAQIAQALSQIAMEFTQEVDTGEEGADGMVLNDIIRHLVVGGNHGYELYPDGGLRGIPLHRYVTLRDTAGKLLEFCIKDPMDFQTLKPDLRAAALAAGYNPEDPKNRASTKSPRIKVFTHGYREDGKFKVYQEIQNVRVPQSMATWTPEALPYRFLRFVSLEDENYGRSYCEDYEADLQSMDGIEQIIQEGTASAALFIRFVRPGGLTNKKAVAQALNGAVLTGNAEDVTTLQSNKAADFSIAAQRAEKIESRLSRAFLLNSAVQRPGERVTAEEIRFVAKELDEQLGGAYRNQVAEFQAPYARLKLRALMRAGRITRVPPDSVRMRITTGAAALGKLSELQNMDLLLAPAAQGIGPEFIAQALNPRVYYGRRAAILNVDTDGLILTEEEVEDRQQQAQQAQLAQGVAPEVVRQVGNVSTKAAEAQAEAAQNQEQQ